MKVHQAGFEKKLVGESSWNTLYIFSSRVYIKEYYFSVSLGKKGTRSVRKSSAVPFVFWNFYLKDCVLDKAACSGCDSSANKNDMLLPQSAMFVHWKPVCCTNCTARSLGNTSEKVTKGKFVKLFSLCSVSVPSPANSSPYHTCPTGLRPHLCNLGLLPHPQRGAGGTVRWPFTGHRVGWSFLACLDSLPLWIFCSGRIECVSRPGMGQ